jgi:hypothetical protein
VSKTIEAVPKIESTRLIAAIKPHPFTRREILSIATRSGSGRARSSHRFAPEACGSASRDDADAEIRGTGIMTHHSSTRGKPRCASETWTVSYRDLRLIDSPRTIPN